MTLLSHLWPRALLLMGFLWLAEGCRRHASVAPQPNAAAETPAVVEQPLQAKLTLALEAADHALAEGRTNEAIASVESAFNNPDFAPWRPQVLENLLRLLLRCDRGEVARQCALSASTDPALAADACGLIYRYYHDMGDLNSALAWSATIADRPGVPHAMQQQACTWNIADNIALHNDEQALSMLGKSVQSPTLPADGLTLARFTIDAFLNAGRTESTEKALAIAATIKTDPAELEHLNLVTHVRIASASGDWTTLTNRFQMAVSTLKDDELNGLLQGLISTPTRPGKPAVIDQCAQLVLFSPMAPSQPHAVETAARKWGEDVVASDKKAFPGCLTAMLRAHVPADLVADLYNSFYYSFSDQPAQLKELIIIGETLAPLCKNEANRNDIKIKALDGCFLTQDYDRALALLAARIPGPDRTEQWHATAITKIKAHRALQQHQPREAVTYFREFMGQLRAAKDADVPDPVTGLLFPKEMVLGRNAKRIGDILAGIPDPAEAAQAYAEARELYATALKKATEAEVRKVIGDELAALPK